MRQEIKKYTLNDMRYINKILEAFCNKYFKRNVIVKGKHGETTFRSLSTKKTNFFKSEGLEVEELIEYGFKRKSTINGMDVEITAIDKTKNDYKSQGIIISILCQGETDNALKADIDRKERKLITYLNKYGIPLNRVCVESSLQCEYKFTKIRGANTN